MHECVFWVCGRAQWEIAGHHAYAQESPSGSQRLPALTQTRQSGCPQRWGELSWVLSWTSKLSPKFENPRSSKPCTHRQQPTYHIQRWFYTIRCKSSQNIVYHNIYAYTDGICVYLSQASSLSHWWQPVNWCCLSLSLQPTFDSDFPSSSRFAIQHVQLMNSH